MKNQYNLCKIAIFASFFLLVTNTMVYAKSEHKSLHIKQTDTCKSAICQQQQKIDETRLKINKKDLFPESAVYDQVNKRYLVSSVKYGDIYSVRKLNNGKTSVQVFVSSPKLISTMGLYIDIKRNLLLVAVSDPGVSKKTIKFRTHLLSRLVVYDLKTAKEINSFDLSLFSFYKRQLHFTNDITVDLKGNIYVSDSFSGMIYRINLEKRRVELLYFHKNLEAPEGKFGANGIVYLDGKLIITNSFTKKLYLLDLKELYTVKLTNLVKCLHEITLDKPQGFDGLVAVNNQLYGVGYSIGIKKGDGFKGSLFRIELSKDKTKASLVELVKDISGTPTSITVKNNRSLIVLGSRLSSLFITKKSESTFLLHEYNIKELETLN